MQTWVVGIPPVLATIMTRFLTETGHRARLVAGWDEFEAALGDAPPEEAGLAVLGHAVVARDVELEGLRAARQHHPDLLFGIVLEGNPPPASVAFETGVFGYLGSPPRLAELELLLMRAEEYRTLSIARTTHVELG